jgi:hypothetical protein
VRFNPSAGELLGISIKDEPFTRDQSNLQEILITFADLSGKPVNEGMTFQTSLQMVGKSSPCPNRRQSSGDPGGCRAANVLA